MAACIPVFSVAACSMPWSESPVDEFIRAVNEGDFAAAAEHTTDPESTESYLTGMHEGIGETSVNVSLDDSDESESRTNTTWTVPSGEAVTTEGTVNVDDDSGLINWSPSFLDSAVPDDATIIYSEDRDFDTPVVDRTGNEILTWTPVTVVSAGPDQIPAASQIAVAVSGILPDISPEWIEEQINSADGDTATLFTLRAEDMDQVRGALEGIDGLDLREDGQLLPGSRDLSTPLDPGLTDYWNETLSTYAGWSLRAVTDEGQQVIAGEEPEQIERITTTVDLPMQSAAQRAVDNEDRPAAFVAIAANGDVLAVAQNAAARDQGAIALTGLYPPGSTFKTVTTAAALETGTVGPDDIVECPATAEIDGRVIPNNDNFELGSVPMHTAFADSCNTTQGFISQDFAPETMRDTALSLGLGVDFDAPGFTTVTGSVPVTDPGAARVEAAIGQGEVLASPFGLALMEASLANNGAMAVPRLISGVEGPADAQVAETTSDQQPAPLSPETVAALRAMMVETVTTGSASALSDIPDLGGKTGTAETGEGAAHGWFTGIAGDVGFVSFVEGGDSSGPAITVAGDFLRDEWRGN